MLFRYWTEGLVFICEFLIVIAIPCIGAAWLGSKLINQIGMYPSRAASFQMAIVWKFLLVVAVSFGLMVLFFQIYS